MRRYAHSAWYSTADRPGRLIGTAVDFLELTKPSITGLVLVTALAGAILAEAGFHDAVVLLHMIIGTGLSAAGASALNQYLERDLDGLMRRTQNRPLPRGRVSPRAALGFGLSLSIVGVVCLAVLVNGLAAVVAAFTVVSYLLIYTPSKRATWLSTLIGAVPGALPPVIGWAAIRGQLDAGAWVLFAIMFLWQIPHFLAIAWMYRTDYARAGFPVLPVCDPEGGRTARFISWNCIALLLVSLLPTWLGLTGMLYLVGALVIGIAFLAFGLATAVYKSNLSARRLLVASVIYHPLLLALILLDAVPGILHSL